MLRRDAKTEPFARTEVDDRFHHLWVHRNRMAPAENALRSAFLDLNRTSDVDSIISAQVDEARHVLRLRQRLTEGDGSVDPRSILDGQRRVVERFLAARRSYYGPDQSQPVGDPATFCAEGRDRFVVIKYMDEAPHITDTLNSLLAQRGIDLGRLVIVAVNNNSRDGSDLMVRDIAGQRRTAARVVCLDQAAPGAGHAARLGVDSCIATVYEMCRHDGLWSRLQTATIAVSDGDTIYNPAVMAEVDRILDACPDVDGVVPFLTYKFASALRLFRRHAWLRDARPAESGLDIALAFLEAGGVQPDEKWRWHAVIGHDLFLYWAFAGMGLPEAMVLPDTSDALKTFRAWSFAVGGQHQLRRPGLRVATGNDYQSGRVLQVVGSVVRLGSATALAQTETDRLLKMIRNLARDQPVFYGGTRAEPLERATGLYLHLTRIQGDLEADIRGYDDRIFESRVFPERILFPLRWILQNAVSFAAHGPTERAEVSRRALSLMFSAETCVHLETTSFSTEALDALASVEFERRQATAERIAEAVIRNHHAEIMRFYRRTLQRFFEAHHVAPGRCSWLLDGLDESPNALLEELPAVDCTLVWDDRTHNIDEDRGQVTGIRIGTT